MKKIGILLDDLKINRWQEKIADYIEKHPGLKLEILIINNNHYKKTKSSILYRFFQAADRKIYPFKNDAFVSEKYLFPSTLPILRINGIETSFSYTFLPEDIIKIRDLELDVLIRFGFGILKGDILKAAKFGVWSLHHGDNKINRGGPPGFWEVVNGEEVTGATLQILSSDLDGGKVIERAYTKTNSTSFNRNKNEVFWSGVELFTSSLNDLALNRIPLPESMTDSYERPFYYYPLYKDPRNLEAIKIHLKFWIRRIIEVSREFLDPPQWFILYKLKKAQNTETSIFRYKKLIPPKGYDWADPFVIENDNNFYIFFEELPKDSNKAHISYFPFSSSGELLSKVPKKVLEEEWHLSYPFIFKEKDKFYMVPEAANSNELWIYECEKFPDKWVKKKRLFKNKQFYDATLLKYEGLWYLFGTEKVIDESSREQYLFIYFTNDIFSGTLEAHPNNPIYRDARVARPAGRIFTHNGKLIRPSQIGAPKYGYGIQFSEITALSPTLYEEIKVDQILPYWQNNLVATHTYNTSGGFTVLDAQGKINR